MTLLTELGTNEVGKPRQETLEAKTDCRESQERLLIPIITRKDCSTIH